MVVISIVVATEVLVRMKYFRMGRKTVYDTINQSVDNIQKNERKMNIHVIIKFMILFY